VVRRILVAAATLAAIQAVGSAAQAQQFLTKTKYYIGTLNCNVSGSVGLIFGSSKDLSCVFVTINGGSETYHGSITKFGIDIGFTKAVHVLWNVYSLGTDRGAGALSGQFAGGQQSVSAGASAGTAGLVGGRNNDIVLESLAFARRDAGLNFADGVAEMTLTPSP
jgi:hypothetical protein